MPVQQLGTVATLTSLYQHAHTITPKRCHLVITYYGILKWARAFLTCPIPRRFALTSVLQHNKVSCWPWLCMCYAFQLLISEIASEEFEDEITADEYFIIVQTLINSQEYRLILSPFCKYINNTDLYIKVAKINHLSIPLCRFKKSFIIIETWIKQAVKQFHN